MTNKLPFHTSSHCSEAMRAYALLRRCIRARTAYIAAGLATVVLICICVITRDRDVTNTAQTKSVDTATVMEPLRFRQCVAEAEDVAFRYVDLANDDVGRTELLQYRRFVRDNPGFNQTFGELRRVDIPERYRYYVSLSSNFSHAGISGIHILIVERDARLSSGGGSSFLISSEGESRQLCSYEDYFNGTYSAWCPRPNYGCRNISVRLQYFNFNAYTGNHIPIDKLLWKRCVCNWQKTNDDFSVNARIVTWYRSSSNDWTPKTYDGQRFYPMSTKAFCACVKKFDRMFFIGFLTCDIRLITECTNLSIGRSANCGEINQSL